MMGWLSNWWGGGSAVVEPATPRDAARLRLSFATLRAPDDGVISARMVQPGQVLQPGAELLRIGLPWSGRDFSTGRPANGLAPVPLREASFVPVLRRLSDHGEAVRDAHDHPLHRAGMALEVRGGIPRVRGHRPHR